MLKFKLDRQAVKKDLRQIGLGLCIAGLVASLGIGLDGPQVIEGVVAVCSGVVAWLLGVRKE